MATFDASVVEMALIAVDVSRTARSHPLDRGEGGGGASSPSFSFRAYIRYGPT